jgi:hypothetical protein
VPVSSYHESSRAKPFRWQDTHVTEEVPAEQMRVADVDRKAVVDRLHVAHGEGLITLAEFDSRVADTWQSKTRGDLARITADLPAPRPVVVTPPAARQVARRHRGPAALRVLNTIWLSVTTLNIVIWGLVWLTGGSGVYPWWLWVAVPPGAVLGVLWWTIGGGRDDDEDKGGRTALPGSD